MLKEQRFLRLVVWNVMHRLKDDSAQTYILDPSADTNTYSSPTV